MLTASVPQEEADIYRKTLVTRQWLFLLVLFQPLKKRGAAVIQIQAEGTFVEPEGVAYNSAGRGSGFIIDESGIAVTNNHVVTGAALVKVWLDGENEPRNARIVATSECSDLAVIDIEGDGFPYLEWFDGESKVGNEVYVAGFPLGDPEYTLTRGIVSKENAGGESPWASVDHVIEYECTSGWWQFWWPRHQYKCPSCCCSLRQ